MATTTKPRPGKAATPKTIADYPEVTEGKRKREELRQRRQELLSELNDDGGRLTSDERADIERQVREAEKLEREVSHQLQFENITAQQELTSQEMPGLRERYAEIDAAVRNLEQAHADRDQFVAESKRRGVSFAHVVRPELIQGFSRAAKAWRRKCQDVGLLPRE